MKKKENNKKNDLLYKKKSLTIEKGFSILLISVDKADASYLIPLFPLTPNKTQDDDFNKQQLGIINKISYREGSLFHLQWKQAKEQKQQEHSPKKKGDNKKNIGKPGKKSISENGTMAKDSNIYSHDAQTARHGWIEKVLSALKDQPAIGQIVIALPAAWLIKPHQALEALLCDLELLTQHLQDARPAIETFSAITQAEGIYGFYNSISPYLRLDQNQLLAVSNFQENNAENNLPEKLEIKASLFYQALLLDLSSNDNNRNIIQKILFINQLSQISRQLQKVSQSINGPIKGIYLCSNKQTSPQVELSYLSIDQLASNQSQHASLEQALFTNGMWNNILQAQVLQSRSWKRLYKIPLLGKLLKRSDLKKFKRYLKRAAKRSSYTTASYLICITITLGAVAFTYPVARDWWLQHSTMHVINQVDSTSSAGPNKTLATILHRYLQINAAENKFATQETGLSRNQLYRKNIIQKQLNNLIAKQFIPYIKHKIIISLQQTKSEKILTENQQQALYNTLKAYLMLCQDSTRRQPEYLQQWLNELLRKNKIFLNADQEQSLNQLFTLTLTQKHLNDWSGIDYGTVQQTRNWMSQQTLPDQALSLLASQSGKKIISLPESSAAHRPKRAPSFVSNIYTVSEFDNLYHDIIANSLHLIQKQNWIMDNSSHKLQQAANNSELGTMAQARYLQRYVNAWHEQQQYLSKTVPAKNIVTIITDLQSIIDKNSKLNQQLKLILDNTASIPDEPIFTQIISNRFSALTLSWQQLTTLSPTQIAIKRLISSLQLIAQNKNHAAAWHKFLISQLKQPDNLLETTNKAAQQLETPYKQLLLNDIMSLYKIGFAEASKYINQQWSSQLYPQLKQQLMHKYPLDLHAKKSLSIDTFTRFFSPQGILVSFYTHNIAPYVDQNKQPWKMKYFIGHSIKLSSKALNNWEQINQIANTYFTSSSTQDAKKHALSQAQPHYQFTIQPIVINNSWPRLKLIIAGQQVTASSSMLADPRKQITWSQQSPQLSLALVERKNKHHYVLAHATGPWSWIKVISSGSLTPLKGQNRRFIIDYKVADQSFRYLIINPTEIQPFQHGLLNQNPFPQQQIADKKAAKPNINDTRKKPNNKHHR